MPLVRVRTKLTECSGIDTIRLPPGMNVEFAQVWQLHPTEHGKIRIGEREIDVPRWQQSYNIPYWFSGMWHEAIAVPTELCSLWEFVNRLGYGSFNQILVNWYENGHHYIGRHQDNEGQLVGGSPILTVSLGESRIFRIRRKGGKGEAKWPVVKDMSVTDRTILVMWGSFQKELWHEVPKITGSKGRNVGPRISVTFRQMVECGSHASKRTRYL